MMKKKLRKIVVNDVVYYFKIETSYLITLYNSDKKPLAYNLGSKLQAGNLKELKQYIIDNYECINNQSN